MMGVLKWFTRARANQLYKYVLVSDKQYAGNPYADPKYYHKAQYFNTEEDAIEWLEENVAKVEQAYWTLFKEVEDEGGSE